MRQAGVIRVETIEELMDVAQIVSSQPLPDGPRHRRLQQLRAPLARWWRTVPPRQGLGVERIVTDVDLDAGMSRALPALRRSLQETPDRGRGARRGGRAAAGARAHRRKDRRRCWPNAPRRPANRWLPPSPASWIPPSTWRAWSAPEPEQPDQPAPARRCPCYSNPGAAVAALAAVVRYAQWLDRDQGLFVEPEGCDPEAARADLELLLRDVRRRAARTGWTRRTAARLLGHYGIRRAARPSGSRRRRRPWPPPSGWAGRWR